MENSTKWPSHSPDGTVSSSNLKDVDDEEEAWGNIKARFLLLLEKEEKHIVLLLRPTRRPVFADEDTSREENEEEEEEELDDERRQEEEEEEANISRVCVCVFISRVSNEVFLAFRLSTFPHKSKVHDAWIAAIE
jgi:hypothetical protein